MDKFFKSQTCLSGLHCKVCRDPKAIKFRQKWVDAFSQGSDPNFVCPYGRPWGYDKNLPVTNSLNKVAHGAKGLIKAIARVDRTKPHILKARQDICNQCDEKAIVLKGVTTKCKQCGCVLPAKQRIASERCPIGKWDRISLPILSN